jgi:hypothetical protein
MVSELVISLEQNVSNINTEYETSFYEKNVYPLFKKFLNDLLYMKNIHFDIYTQPYV